MEVDKRVAGGWGRRESGAARGAKRDRGNAWEGGGGEQVMGGSSALY